MLVEDLLFIAILFTFFPTIVIPYSHRLFRNKYTFLFMLFLAIIFSVATYFVFDVRLTRGDKINSLLGLAPLTFCILYKVFDKIILTTKGRHIYFYTKLNSFLFVDPESNDATYTEFIIQMFLCFFPIIIWIIVGNLIF
jgi:hypothetical protein